MKRCNKGKMPGKKKYAKESAQRLKDAILQALLLLLLQETDRAPMINWKKAKGRLNLRSWKCLASDFISGNTPLQRFGKGKSFRGKESLCGL